MKITYLNAPTPAKCPALGNAFEIAGVDAMIVEDFLLFNPEIAADNGHADRDGVRCQRAVCRSCGQPLSQLVDTDYRRCVTPGCPVTAVYVDGSSADSAKAGDDAVVVLDHTPFYAESGGQVGDTGELRNASSRMIVEDTIKVQAAVFGHHGRIVEGEIKARFPFLRGESVFGLSEVGYLCCGGHGRFLCEYVRSGDSVRRVGGIVNFKRRRPAPSGMLFRRS